MKHFFWILTILGLLNIAKAQKTKGIKALIQFENDFVKLPFVNPDTHTHSNTDWYILNHEITNAEFKWYANYKIACEGLSKTLLDTTQWDKIDNKDIGNINALRYLYHTHKAFDNYPVVNISYDNAKAFCKWLTEYYQQFNTKYKKVLFRLPTMEEWKTVLEDDIQTVNTDYSKANVKWKLSDGTFSYINDGFIYQNPVKYFMSNKYNVYGMIGNVSEMVEESEYIMGSSFYDTITEGFISSQTASSILSPDPRIGFRIVMECSK